MSDLPDDAVRSLESDMPADELAPEPADRRCEGRPSGSDPLPPEARAIARALTEAGSVAVCGHVHPDGDAVGSVLGAALALRQLGIEATPTLALPGDAPSLYSFLPGFESFRPAAELSGVEVLLALDTPSLDRLGSASVLAQSAGSVFAIDHHPDCACYGSQSWVDPSCAAVGQMLWHLLPVLGVEPTPEIASCLYVALITDTGRFSYGNTDARVMTDAAEMIGAGADPFDLYTRVYEARSCAFLKLLGTVLARLEIVNEGRVAYSWLATDDIEDAGAEIAETENLVDAVRTVGGVDVALLMKCLDGECRVSLRAKGAFDVATVAREFGGGGHRAAAGYTFAGSRDEALALLLPRLPGRSGA